MQQWSEKGLDSLQHLRGPFSLQLGTRSTMPIGDPEGLRPTAQKMPKLDFAARSSFAPPSVGSENSPWNTSPNNSASIRPCAWNLLKDVQSIPAGYFYGSTAATLASSDGGNRWYTVGTPTMEGFEVADRTDAALYQSVKRRLE